MIFSYKWRMLTALELHVIISEPRFIARTALSIYDTIQEFNVDWIAKEGELNLAHVTEN